MLHAFHHSPTTETIKTLQVTALLNKTLLTYVYYPGRSEMRLTRFWQQRIHSSKQPTSEIFIVFQKQEFSKAAERKGTRLPTCSSHVRPRKLLCYYFRLFFGPSSSHSFQPKTNCLGQKLRHLPTAPKFSYESCVINVANVAESKYTVLYISKEKLERNRSVQLRCLGTLRTYRAAAFIYCSSFFCCEAGSKKCCQEGRSSSYGPGSNGVTVTTDARLVSSQLLYRAVTTAEITQRASDRLNCVHDYHGVCGHDCTTHVKGLRNLR